MAQAIRYQTVAYTNPPVSTDAQRAIDSTIERLREDKDSARILALKRERNNLSPAGKIPVEILIRILLAFMPTTKLQDIWRNNNDHMHVTQAFHSWRDTALNFPPLWSNIFLHRLSVAWAEEYVRRSSTTSLAIIGQFGAGETPAQAERNEAKLAFLQELMKTEGTRIKSLDISGEQSEASDNILSLINLLVIHAQHTETILIELKPEAFPYAYGLTYTKPIDLNIIWRLPQLRTFSIRGLSARWPADDVTCTFTPSGLTTLHLDDISHIPTDTMLNILALTPALQTLNLSESPDSDFLYSLPEDYVVPLEKLTTLRFEGSSRRCLSILSHLLYPLASTKVSSTIHFHRGDRSSSAFNSDIERIFGFCGTIKYSPLQFGVSIEPESSTGFRFYDNIYVAPKDGTGRVEEILDAPIPSAQVTIIGLTPSMDLLEWLLPTFPLSSVRRLELDHRLPVDSEMIQFIMAATPNVTILKISCVYIYEFCSALVGRVEGGDGDGNDSDGSFKYLPNLSGIQLNGVEYNRPYEPYSALQLILWLLVSRNNHGARIKSLHLGFAFGFTAAMRKGILESGAVDEILHQGFDRWERYCREDGDKSNVAAE